MLPDCCVVKCHSASLPNSQDCRLSSTSLSDSDTAVFVRQNLSALITGDLFFDPQRRQPCIRHLVVLQDVSVPLPLDRLLRRFDRRTLTTLHVVDCRLGFLDDDLLDGVCLRTLVLSGTQLRRLPLSFFQSSAATCDVLKVDRNRLTEIPPELGRLDALSTFCCDAQRPRLRSLPTTTLGRLTQLEVLSFSDNRIVDIGWLPAALPQLRVLLCRRNRIARLPEDLASLERLRVLDISHNRLREISASFLSVVVRLCRLEFFNSTLRPAHLRRADVASLSAHLELESRCRRYRQQRSRRRTSAESIADTVTEQPPTRPSTGRSVVERDITIAVVGSSRSGKTTLADAMAVSGRSYGPSGSLGRRGNTPPPSTSASRGFSARHFDVMQQDGSVCQVNVLVLSPDDILNEYIRQLSIDLFLLAFDVLALDPAGQPVNGTRSSTRRPFARLQMWLQALYEVEPDCRVVLVGTHADRVPTERLSDIWRRLVDGLLDPARPHHVLRTAAATSASRRRCSCSNCLLCRPKYLAVRHAEEVSGAVSPVDTGSLGHSSGASPAVTVDPQPCRATGFVDLSLPIGNGAVKANATNGHVVSGGDRPAARALRFPHIVGYYETDAVTVNRPSLYRDKDPTTVLYENARLKPTSATSVSVERLLAAILRLTITPSGDHNQTSVTPSNWLKLSRLLAAFVSNTSSSYAHLPLVGIAEAIDRAKQLEMDEEETTLALRYLHRRGLVVYVPGIGELSTRIVCVGATWFVQTVNRALSSLAVSTASRDELARCLDRELAVQAQQRQRQSLRQSALAAGKGGTNQPTAAAVHVAQQWLFDAILDVGTGLALSSATVDPLYLFPALLETGAPSSDVWPDLPGCSEKQVTCEFRIRSLRPGFFSDVVALVADVRRPPGRELRRLRTVPLTPLPVFLAEHVVFACSCDVAGCDDCCAIRTVSAASTSPESPSCVSRVHIALVSELDVVRVQVRSAEGACCVMRAVLDFIDVYLDDLPDDRQLSGTCHAEDVSSIESLPSYTSVSEPNVVALDVDDDDDDDDDRQYFLLCPKCVLLCLEGPDRIRAHRRTSTLLPSRRPVCARWHHLGSWARAAVGDYRTFAFGIGSGGGRVAVCASIPPDYEYPRLVIVLPPSVTAAVRDWYLFARASFVEDVDIHLLCENPAYWHFVDGSVFRIRSQPPGTATAAARGRSVAGGGRSVPIQLVALAAAVLRVVACGQSGRLVAAVVSELVRTCGQLFPPVDFDLGVVGGDEGRERVAAMLSWMLTAVGGPPVVDVPRGLAADSAGELAVVESAVFHAPAKGSRRELARLLRAHDAGERFGVLRAVVVGHEVRWVCERHFVELRRCCMQPAQSHLHRR